MKVLKKEHIGKIQKTFEYYSASPLDESSKVLISTTFKVVNSNIILINSDDITSDKAVVSNLAPSLLGNLGRYELDITLSPIS
jgi:hypothetical protein